MKFFGISNARDFFEMIQNCTGDVYSVESDGRRQDMKQMAGFLIQSGMAGRIGSIPEINLSVEKSSDVRKLMNYAGQMC